MMAEHVCEWRIWIAGYKVDDTCHGDRWIECECGEWRSCEQANGMLNQHSRLLAVAVAAKASLGEGATYEFFLNPPDGMTVDTKFVALAEALAAVEDLL